MSKHAQRGFGACAARLGACAALEHAQRGLSNAQRGRRRRSEVGAGAARSVHAQRGWSRRSEVGVCAARFKKKKIIKAHCPPAIGIDS